MARPVTMISGITTRGWGSMASVSEPTLCLKNAPLCHCPLSSPNINRKFFHWHSLYTIDVINVYNVYKQFFVNAFIILSTFISIKITWAKRSKLMTGSQAIVHCVRIGHCLSSLGHGASDGKQLPHDGAPPTEQTSRGRLSIDLREIISDSDSDEDN